jgi:hypothetical protein
MAALTGKLKLATVQAATPRNKHRIDSQMKAKQLGPYARPEGGRHQTGRRSGRSAEPTLANTGAVT